MKQTNEGINTERQETRNIDKNESGLIATCKKIQKESIYKTDEGGMK